MRKTTLLLAAVGVLALGSSASAGGLLGGGSLGGGLTGGLGGSLGGGLTGNLGGSFQGSGAIAPDTSGLTSRTQRAVQHSRAKVAKTAATANGAAAGTANTARGLASAATDTTANAAAAGRASATNAVTDAERRCGPAKRGRRRRDRLDAGRYDRRRRRVGSGLVNAGREPIRPQGQGLRVGKRFWLRGRTDRWRDVGQRRGFGEGQGASPWR